MIEAWVSYLRDLCISTNWQNSCLEKLEELGLTKRIHEIYGSLSSSIVGSARATLTLPHVSCEEAEKHIEEAHSMGLKFNYALNAGCLGGLEYADKYRIRILELLEWLNNSNVDSVIVAIPYLAELVKEQFPALNVTVSLLARVNSTHRAKLWEYLGADRINIDFMANRNFSLIRNIRKTVKCDLEVIVNETCLFQCPFREYHLNLLSHASQVSDTQLIPIHFFEYPEVQCSLIRYTNFSEILRARWIRPEDTDLYSKIGIDYFKIRGREVRSDSNRILAISAYAHKKYDGNLLKLLPIPVPRELVSFCTEDEYRRLWTDPPLFINNRSLDGFIKFFEKINCENQCGLCTYCDDLSKKIVKVTSEKRRKELVIALRKLLSMLTRNKTIQPDLTVEKDISV